MEELDEHHGFLRFSYSLRPILSQDDFEVALSAERQNDLHGIMEKHREHSHVHKAIPEFQDDEQGVLVVNVHDVAGMDEPGADYELELAAFRGGTQEVKIEKSEKKKPPMQFAKPFYIPLKGKF